MPDMREFPSAERVFEPTVHAPCETISDVRTTPSMFPGMELSCPLVTVPNSRLHAATAPTILAPVPVHVLVPEHPAFFTRSCANAQDVGREQHHQDKPRGRASSCPRQHDPTRQHTSGARCEKSSSAVETGCSTVSTAPTPSRLPLRARGVAA